VKDYDHAMGDTKQMSLPPWAASFPSGIPFLSFGYGAYVWAHGSRTGHALHHDWDLICMRRGELALTLQDRQESVIGTDTLFLLPPFVSVAIRQSRPTAEFWFCHFNFRRPTVKIPESMLADVMGPADKASIPLLFTRAQAPRVFEAYQRLIEFPLETSSGPWRLERALIALVAELVQFATHRAANGEPVRMLTTTTVADQRIESVARLIDANPANPWRVSALAKSVHLSTGRLNELFRRSFGVSLKRYIVRSRLQLALKRLAAGGDSPRSIREIAAACGFSSQHYFSQQFKAHFNVSPLAYRNHGGLG
jgi:AraC-like DNA-binding protein